MKKSPALDTLRAIAIILVLLCHTRHLSGAPPLWKFMGLRSALGADIFFVLSGWLITLGLWLNYSKYKKFLIKSFFIKRFFRIIPIFWLATITAAFFGNWNLKEIVAHFSLLQCYLSPTNWQISWTIPVFVFFYMTIPIILFCLVKLKHSSQIILSLFFISFFSLLFRLWAYSELQNYGHGWYSFHFYNQMHLRFDGIFVGSFLATLWHFKKELIIKLKPHSKLLLVSSFMAAILFGGYPFLTENLADNTFRLSYYNAVFQYYLFSLSCGIFILAAVLGKHKLWGNQKWIQFLAKHSYVIYLFHMFVLAPFIRNPIAFPFPEELQPYLNGLVFLIFTCILSVIIHKAFEMPINRIKDKLLSAT